MRVVMHIGLQKTASTLIQRNLQHRRAKLRESGFDYRRLKPGDNVPAKHLPRFTSRMRSFSWPRHAPPDDRDVVDELEEQLSGSPSYLLSDENVLGPVSLETGEPAYRMAETVIEWVSGVLPVDRADFILYVRRQDTFLESTYLQRIHVGKTFGFREYVAGSDIDSLNWHRLADRIAGVVGRDHLSVLPYESIRSGELSYLNTFLRYAGCRHSFEEGDLAPRKSNRSYSALALEIARRTNDLLTGEDARVFRRFLQQNFSNATHAPAELLSDQRRREILEQHEASNRRLFEQFVHPDHFIPYWPSSSS